MATVLANVSTEAPEYRFQVIRRHRSGHDRGTMSARLHSTDLAVVDGSPPRLVGDELPVEFGADLMVENLSPRTVQAYLADLFSLARHVRKPLQTVTIDDLADYLRSLVAQRCSVATRARRLVAIKRFYDWLRRTRHLPGSIAQDLRPIKRAKGLHRWWTPAQVAAFRRAFDGEPAVLLTGTRRLRETPRQYHLVSPRVVVTRDRAICELGLMGLRVSEVVWLSLEDVIDVDDPDRAAILVHRKGRKDQVLPLVADARVALRQWLAVRPKVPSPAVFVRLPFQPGRPGRDPGRMHYESLGCLVQAYAARAGLALPHRKAFHHLRHTAGQQMAELGYGIEEAQTFLGHESPATTQIYYEVTNARLRTVSRRFGYEQHRKRPHEDP